MPRKTSEMNQAFCATVQKPLCTTALSTGAAT